MATIFSREEKAEALFGEILKNPEACRRLMDTFNDSLDMADVLDTLKDGGTRYDELGVFLPLEHFADRLERHVETATKIVYGE